jgi:pyruvate formate lyase activating enzyme
MNPLDSLSNLSRRRFLHYAAKTGTATVIAYLLNYPAVGEGLSEGFSSDPAEPVEARFWSPVPGTHNVQCRLCPESETLQPGQTGKCRVRKNQNGRLITLAYQRPCVANIDPIGKNPIFHFMPEILVLALAHAGCNLRCGYCQNWQFSQKSPLKTKNITPFRFSDACKNSKNSGAKGISFTYTEADCAPEFTSDFASFCRDQGLATTLCTAGYLHPEPFRKLIHGFDAVTITYKGATDKFYRSVIGGKLKPVQKNMEHAKKSAAWLEVATLLVPSLNDHPEEIRAMARFIKSSLGPETPWILERFHPSYRLRHLPPTAKSTLEQAMRIGQEEGLQHVYISNFSPHPGNHTYCHSCGGLLVNRLGFSVLSNRISGNRCPDCHSIIPGVWC